METTLWATATLPACHTSCGLLFDVNGGCVPPAAPTAGPAVYQNCFCANAKLAPFKTGVSGVCPQGACQGPDLSKIRGWYTDFCGAGGAGNGGGGNGGGAGAGAGAGARSSSSIIGGGNGQGVNNNNNVDGPSGSWLDNHWQWVVFLVVMIVGIVGIWIGACIWRRRYLRTKDRQYALGTNMARATESGRIVPNASQAGSIHVPGAGMFTPAPLSSAAVYDDGHEKARNKWLPGQRN